MRKNYRFWFLSALLVCSVVLMVSGCGKVFTEGGGGSSDVPNDLVDTTGITVTPETASISVGGTVRLVAEVSPSNASNKGVTWDTSDRAYATVEAGLVYGKAAGTVIITATTVDKKWTASCQVQVTSNANPSDTAAPNNCSISINGGDPTSNSLDVILNLAASDNVGVAGYYVSENNTPPLPDAAGWASITPAVADYNANVSFTLSAGAGEKTVYVWFKDAAGNVSDAGTASMTAIIPAAPGAATVTAGNAQLSLRWTTVDYATGYEVWRGTSADQSSASLVTNTADANYIIAGLTNGTTYYVWLKAGNNVGISDFGTRTSGTPMVTFDNAVLPGDAVNVTTNSTTFKMVYVNNQGSVTFPTGTDDRGSASTVYRSFMGETEVTNALMAEVLNWAKSRNYIIETPGAHNEVNANTVKYGSKVLVNLAGSDCKINYAGSFTVDLGQGNYPAVHVTWYGAIMFCNWLTEMQDGNNANVVYGGIGDTWDDLETYNRIGYRLPSRNEWEYAARYRGNDSENTVIGYSNPCYFTKGNSASGATAYYNNADATGRVAWYKNNAENMLHPVAQKNANTLGLCDMSGNVWEWCSSGDGSGNHAIRGGSWFNDPPEMQIGGSVLYAVPLTESFILGFRIAKTK